MSDGILIGLGALVLAGLIYFARAQRTKTQRSEDARNQRIQRVADSYMVLRRDSSDKGLSALLRSGVSTLNDDAEIRESIGLIRARGEDHPLASKPKKLVAFDGADLKIMFDYMTDNHLTFGDINHLEAIERSGAAEQNN